MTGLNTAATSLLGSSTAAAPRALKFSSPMAPCITTFQNRQSHWSTLVIFPLQIFWMTTCTSDSVQAQGRSSEAHELQSWTFTSSGMPALVAPQPSPSPVSAHTNPSTSSSQGLTSKVGIIVGICAGAAGILLLAASFFFARYWRRKSSMKHDKFNLAGQNLVPRMFSYKELTKATRSFNRSELLGSGGFGAVYKGTLPSGALVAVKWMRTSKYGEESFQAEAASLSQIRHRNLVQLRGWCREEEQMFLVYDYMCHGSLDEWLFPSSERRDAAALPLTLRHSVLRGVAAALSYLHKECAQCVLHRDIKSSNVLLDGQMRAYLGDFGLARLIDHQKMEKTTMVAGTLGYMAPELPHTEKATKASDVYSFGVLMLEVICGARPLDAAAMVEEGKGILVDNVWRAHEVGNLLQVASLRLLETTDASDFEAHIPIDAPDTGMEEKKMIRNSLELGLLCCNRNPEDRPSARLVSQLLQASENMEMSMPALPSCKAQAHYSRRGFSELAIRPWSDASALSMVIGVEEAVQLDLSHSNAPS